MKNYLLSEFPNQGVFPLEFVASSSEAVVRGTEKSRKVNVRVTVPSVRRGRVMVVRVFAELEDGRQPNVGGQWP